MSEGSGKNTKIYCANCIHCKLFSTRTDDGEVIQKVRCAAGHWKKKLGEEKYYRFVTVCRRTVPDCSDYVAMGETRPFIKELKKSMPGKDDVYIVD